MRWSETITLEFVKLYLRHECLWNPAHPGYRIKYQRDKAYAEISAEFKRSTMKNLSILEVKIKIKNLRTTYAQQVHKILKKSRPDSIYEPSLIWFQEMDRCMKHIPTNRHSTLYSDPEPLPEIKSSCEVWIDEDLQKASANIKDLANDPLFAQLSVDNCSLHNDDLICVKEDDCLPDCMKKPEICPAEEPVCSNASTSSVPEEDEFDVYGKYIAAQLRKMDINKALRLQLEIQNIVSEARISELTKK